MQFGLDYSVDFSELKVINNCRQAALPRLNHDSFPVGLLGPRQVERDSQIFLLNSIVVALVLAILTTSYTSPNRAAL